MLIYLDTNIVIYAVENPAVFGPRADARLQAIAASDHVAVSELTRTECCSYPLRHADFALLRRYDNFFRADRRHDFADFEQRFSAGHGHSSHA